MHELDSLAAHGDERALGISLARQMQSRKAIMGVFDEGCMGMYNAIIPDENC